MKQETINRIRKFTEDRDWDQFHSPANLAKSISIEANELLECFQWDDEHPDLSAVEEEMADVLTYLIDMAERLQIDLIDVTDRKMDKNALKYPVEKARGNSLKYDKY